MVEKPIEETKKKELVHIKHIWVFICPIFVQLAALQFFAHLLIWTL